MTQTLYLPLFSHNNKGTSVSPNKMQIVQTIIQMINKMGQIINRLQLIIYKYSQ